MTSSNYDQFAQNFYMACRTIKHVSITKFEAIRTNENRFMGHRSWRIFFYFIWENGLVGILLLTNLAAAINVRRFSKR